MTSKSFIFSEVLGFGWRVMKSNFWFFVGVSIVLFLISSLGQVLGQVMKHYSVEIPSFLVFALFPVMFIIETILGIGLIKITLSFCDGRKPRFSTLFDGWDCFLRYLGAGLLYSLIVGGIFVVCALPLILSSAVRSIPYFTQVIFSIIFVLVTILSIKFSLCFYFVIDKGLGPVNALRASDRATRGAKWLLFVFGILCGLINILGVLCFIVGVFVTFPTIAVAAALVYRQLSAQTPELAELGISGPDIEPEASIHAAGARFDPGIQSGPGFWVGRSIQLGEDIRPVSSIQGKREEESHNPLWVVVLGVGVLIAAGLGYYLQSGTKGPTVLHRVALSGILYSEDSPSAIIGGKIVKEGDMINDVKVVKIHKNRVEFEKRGRKWTQQAQ